MALIHVYRWEKVKTLAGRTGAEASGWKGAILALADIAQGGSTGGKSQLGANERGIHRSWEIEHQGG